MFELSTTDIAREVILRIPFFFWNRIFGFEGLVGGKSQILNSTYGDDGKGLKVLISG
jgi:hypothetical protein